MSGALRAYGIRFCGDEGMPAEHVFVGCLCIYCPEPTPSPEALDLRHGGGARILTEAEIREAEAKRGGHL